MLIAHDFTHYDTRGPLIDFSFEDIELCRHELLANIQDLNRNKNLNLASQGAAPHKLAVNQIADEFHQLEELSEEETLTDIEKTTIEEYKAALITAVKNHIHQREKAKQTNVAELEAEDSTSLKQAGLWAAFIALMTLEFMPMFISNMMYAKESLTGLMPYFPGLFTSDLMTYVGVGCVISMVSGVVCFVGPILMEKMGITYSSQNKILPSAFEKQLEGANEINQLLSHYNSISSHDYWLYANLAKVFNKRVQHLKDHYPEIKTNLLSSVLTPLMTVFTTISNVSGSIYLAATVMGMITATELALPLFIATMPVTVALVSLLFLLPTIAMTYILRTTSAAQIFDPAAMQHEAVKATLTHFTPVNDNQLDQFHAEKLSQEINQVKAIHLPPPYLDELRIKAVARQKINLENDNISIQEEDSEEDFSSYQPPDISMRSSNRYLLQTVQASSQSAEGILATHEAASLQSQHLRH